MPNPKKSSGKWNGLRRSSIRQVSARSGQKKELAWRSKLKKALLKECGNVCMTCGGTGDIRGLSLSHIIALSRGGKTHRYNCIIEDYICHDKYEKKPELRAEEYPDSRGARIYLEA